MLSVLDLNPNHHGFHPLHQILDLWVQKRFICWNKKGGGLVNLCVSIKEVSVKPKYIRADKGDS